MRLPPANKLNPRPATNMDDKFPAQMNSGTKDDTTPDGSLSSIYRVFGDPSQRDVKVCFIVGFEIYAATPTHLPPYFANTAKWTTNFPKRKPAEDASSLKHAMTARYKLSSDPGGYAGWKMVLEIAG